MRRRGGGGPLSLNSPNIRTVALTAQSRRGRRRRPHGPHTNSIAEPRIGLCREAHAPQRAQGAARAQHNNRGKYVTWRSVRGARGKAYRAPPVHKTRWSLGCQGQTLRPVAGGGGSGRGTPQQYKQHAVEAGVEGRGGPHTLAESGRRWYSDVSMRDRKRASASAGRPCSTGVEEGRERSPEAVPEPSGGTGGAEGRDMLWGRASGSPQFAPKYCGGGCYTANGAK